MPDATVQIVMPAMGDSVAEGTVLEWHKQEGGGVAADETVVEISTDKVDAEVPSPVAGTIVKIHAAEGDTVAVGALLAEISADGSAGAGGAAPATAVSPESSRISHAEALAAAATPAEGTAAVSAAVGETVDIVTPAGGESVSEGTILDWSVRSRSAIRSRRATQSSRSRPTRSTWSCPPRRRGRSRDPRAGERRLPSAR